MPYYIAFSFYTYILPINIQIMDQMLNSLDIVFLRQGLIVRFWRALNYVDRLASNSQRSRCLCLLSGELKAR